MRPSEIKTAEEALQFLGVTEQQVREYFQQVEDLAIRHKWLNPQFSNFSVDTASIPQ